MPRASLQLHLEHRLVRRLLSRFLARASSPACRAPASSSAPAPSRAWSCSAASRSTARARRGCTRRSSWSPPPGRRRGAGRSRSGRSARCGEETTLDQLDAGAPQPAHARRSTSSSASAHGQRRMPPIWNRSCSGAPRAQSARPIKRLGRAWARRRRNRCSACWRISATGSPRPTPSPTTGSSRSARGRRRRPSSAGATGATGRRSWKAWRRTSRQEPERVRASYAVAADRLETIGLVYLWPESN